MRKKGNGLVLWLVYKVFKPKISGSISSKDNKNFHKGFQSSKKKNSFEIIREINKIRKSFTFNTNSDRDLSINSSQTYLDS